MINVLYLVINRSSRLLSRLSLFLSLSLSLVRCISLSSQPGSLTLLLTMLMIVCHISLLLALCLPSLSLQSVLREDQSREDSWPAQPQDFYSRFVNKRDNFIANQIEDSNNERSPSVGVVGAYHLPVQVPPPPLHSDGTQPDDGGSIPLEDLPWPMCRCGAS